MFALLRNIGTGDHELHGVKAFGGFTSPPRHIGPDGAAGFAKNRIVRGARAECLLAARSDLRVIPASGFGWGVLNELCGQRGKERADLTAVNVRLKNR